MKLLKSLQIKALQIVILATLLFLVGYVISNSLTVWSYQVGGNYENVTIDTTLNITNSAPEILLVVINNGENITLNAGVNTTVYCNVTVRDWDNNYSNNVSDITEVNATFYFYMNKSDDQDNPNVHYTDDNCSYIDYVDEYTGIYRCEFDTRYFANNGTWYCNATVIDTINHTDLLANTTSIYPLWALNITPSQIDYGNVAVGDYSDPTREANVTNIGNQQINTSVTGYGITIGDGLAMNCSIRNLTISDEKFSLNRTAILGDMNSLTTSFQTIANFTIPKQTQEAILMLNNTYWRIDVPITENPAGTCTGYIIFSAEQS